MSFTFRARFLASVLIGSIFSFCQIYAQAPRGQAAPSSPAAQDVTPSKPVEVIRPWQPGDPEPRGPLQVVVIEGQNGVNIVKKRKGSARPVVEIRDGKDTPISGASVSFSSPTDGPSETFSNGLRTIEVLTDPTGRATLDDVKPLSLGQFDVTVSATFRSLSATGTISMTNALKGEAKAEANAKPGTSGAGHSSSVSGKTVAILVGVAAAAAIGIGVGLSHHGAASTTTTSTSATIGAGSGGSVGPP